MKCVYIKIMFLMLLGFSSSLSANWKSERENLDQKYSVGQFRIYYTLSGLNAINNKVDTNNNGIPDIVENTGIELLLAQNILENNFGMKNPLRNERYKNEVKFIDIHIIDMKYGGESGDGVFTYNYKNFHETPATSLTISLSNKLKYSSLTPAHELFHVYQNGYTFFKTRWYTEGTARWFEYAFKSGTGKEKRLPETIGELNELLNQTYDAKYFWNRLTHLCNKDNRDFDKSKNISKIKYIGMSESVVKETDIYGYTLMRNLFVNLSKYDKIASKERGIKKDDWPEKEQQSYENNPYILRTILDTIDESGCHNKEVLNFEKLVGEFLKLSVEEKSQVDYTKDIQKIGIPFAKFYIGEKEKYACNPWDLQVYKNKIYIAGGNTNNIGPATHLPAVPIISLDIDTNKFTHEGNVSEEEIHSFDIFNDVLYIPGADATENHDFGNFYFLDDKNRWIKKRTIPNAYHVFSLNYYQHKIFAGISTAKGAEVAWSSDGGDNWATQQLGKYQSTYTVMQVKEKLFAIKQFIPTKRQQKLNETQMKNYHVVAEFKDGAFVPRKDIHAQELFPNTKLNYSKYIRINKYKTIGDRAIIIGGYGEREPFGVYLLSSLDVGKIVSQKIALDPRIKAIDILVRNNQFYILGYQQKGKVYTNSVTKISIDSLSAPHTIIEFQYPAFARSFEEVDGSFYFGIGSDIKNARKYKLKEIHPDTGKILKLDKKFIKSSSSR